MWRVGNGLSIEAKSGNWFLSISIIGQSSYRSQSSKVADYIDNDFRWKADKIREDFLPHEAQAILLTPIAKARITNSRFVDMAPRKKLKAKGVVHEPHESNKNTQQENMVKESVDQVNEVEKDTIASGASKRGRTQQENMAKESVDQVNKVEEDTVASGASKRGRTHMDCLFNARRAGIRKEVAFNKLGQPVGSNAAKFESYIGVVAREKVKITYPTWHTVPEDVKEQIWKSVTLAFNVDHTQKKGCLSSAGVKWRQYKTTLTREYVYKRKTSPDLNIPPPKSGIDEIVWRDFVISRLSTNFMQMSDEHKKIVERNQLPHRLSRKGYARYALEHESLLSGDDDIDRATLWIEGRKNKDGELEGDELKEKAEKIFSFIEQKKDGGSECEVEGGILSQALESKEHYGRLRGIGGVINPSTNFQHHSSKLSNPHLCKQYEIELIAQKKRNIEQDERIRRLEELVFKTNADKVETEELGSCSVKIQRSLHDDTPLDHSHTPVKLVGDDFDLKIVDEKMGLDNDDKLKGKSVALSLESSTDIVAYGTIIKIYDPNELIHGIKLPKNCMRVAIEKAVDESAHLPIPNGDYLTTKDAIGSHVAWPMNLMKLHVQSARKNRKKHEIKTPSLDSSSVPAQLYMLYCYSKLQSTTSRVISIPLDNDVFGHERLLYLNFEDVDPFCRLNPISYTCIVVYLWHLHLEMNKDKVNKFRFIDPYGIGYMPFDRKDQTFLDDQISLRARSLANRLVGTRHDQLVLAPCNVL
ncbi:hypothetical protein ACS0TY_003754 [Phlomoides rotata]